MSSFFSWDRVWEFFPKIVLSEQEVTDLQKFFGVVFDYVIKNNKLIQFDLIDNKNDMFKEVAEDITQQLNSELKQSEANFEEFIDLKKTSE